MHQSVCEFIIDGKRRREERGMRGQYGGMHKALLSGACAEAFLAEVTGKAVYPTASMPEVQQHLRPGEELLAVFHDVIVVRVRDPRWN